jgi:hypothetical protein
VLHASSGHESEVHAFEMQYNSSIEQLYGDFRAQISMRVKGATMGAKYIARRVRAAPVCCACLPAAHCVS